MAQYFELHPDNPQPRLLKQAAAILAKGGVIAVPTDSSYAIACHSRGPVSWTLVPSALTATVTGMSWTSNS